MTPRIHLWSQTQSVGHEFVNQNVSKNNKSTPVSLVLSLFYFIFNILWSESNVSL